MDCSPIHIHGQGLLLLVTDEEGAFWLLSRIVENLLVDYFIPTMLGLLVDQQVLAALVCLALSNFRLF